MTSRRQSLAMRLQRATLALPRRLTAPLGVRPDFLLIGATKAGTTSLYDYLSQHPLVAPARRKEVLYFDLRLERGDYWYRSFFPIRHIRLIEPRILTGEATTIYLSNARAPELAHAMVPNAKLIVLLRNPADRAHSHQQMVHRMKLRSIHSDFALYIKKSRPFWPSGGPLEPMDFPPCDEISDCLTWIRFGLYAEHLAAWLRYFPREQLLVLNSERFFKDPQESLDRITRFLGLDDHVWPAFPVLKSGSYKPLDAVTRRMLLEYYRPHNEKLYELLGERYDWD